MAQGHGSGLALQEYFDTGDDRFLDELRATESPPRLAAIADRWKRDPRPWTRAQIFAYLEQPLDRPGHEPVVRRLFKHAEEQGDHELMGAFLVAFDRLVRREVRSQWRWDSVARTSFTEEVLFKPRNRIPNVEGDPLASWQIPRNGRLFTYATRNYLRRRAWRYFRRLGYQDAAAYVEAIAGALARYRDDDLEEGQNILDAWGLVQALFRHSDVLDFGRAYVNVAEGKAFGDIEPAPRFPELWRETAAGDVLLDLVENAQSRLVRVFAMDTIRREHPNLFERLGVERLLGLMDGDDPDVQQFAAERMVAHPGLATLPIDAWLELLETPNPEALQAICDAMEANVRADRLDLADCVRLACAEPLPVARLALGFLQTKTKGSGSIFTPEDRTTLARLGEARCDALGTEIARFGLDAVGGAAGYETDDVVRFLDATIPTMRTEAFAWVLATPHAYDDSVLWARLAETPYDDLRLHLVEALEGRLRPERLGQEGDTTLWATVLLGVHRGGRHKLKAVRQLCDALAQDPGRADTLLPVLAVVVRSIRRPEMRAGLSAVVTLLDRQPSLQEAVSAALPELALTAESSA